MELSRNESKLGNMYRYRRILLLLLSILFVSCAEKEEVAVPPGAQAGAFTLIPNSYEPGDSVASILSQGAFIPAYTGAQYNLSMDSLDDQAPSLRLYGLVRNGDHLTYEKADRVEATSQQGRWNWSFVASNSKYEGYLTVLEREEARWEGSVQGLLLEGQGVYAPHFSVNLWVTGKYFAPAGDESDTALAAMIQTTLRQFYGQAGVTVDTVRLLYAEEHPLVGARYPSDVTVFSDGLESRFDSLGYGLTGDANEALDLILVGGFTEAGMLGVSPLLGRNLRPGRSGVVIVSTRRLDESCNCFSRVVASDFAYTAAHEIGHFFGLSHTTATDADRESNGDYSLEEDGLSDTPWCQELDGIMNRYVGSTSGIARTWLPKMAITLGCADESNLMFPYEVDGEPSVLSDMQANQFKKTLELFPHD